MIRNMRTRRIFWLIVIFITLVLTGIGFLFFREEKFPFWVMQCIAVVSFFFSFFIYKKLIKPYQLLLSGLDLLKDKDFSTYLLPVKNKDANELIDVFNRMITHLRAERLTVREKNHFLDLLINASPQGIIIMNFDKKITDINPAALKFLGIHDINQVKDEKLNEAPFDLAVTLAELKPGDDIIVRGKGVSAFRCIYSSFIDQGFDHPFILIEELTHELLKIEKESYERIIRMMSHEVNNSVGAIGATLNVVSEILNVNTSEEWKDVLPAIDASYIRCGRLAQFISELADVVRIPEPSFSMIPINELALAVYALTRMECQQRNIELKLTLTAHNELVRADGILFEQVLVNILKNAYESVDKDGEIQIITSSSPLKIVITDNGPGIDKETAEKIFTPFFTTKKTGQGVGLMFVRDVLINHNCKFNLSTQEGVTAFEIIFE